MFKTKTGIVLVDIETSFMKLADFSLKNSGYISHSNILQDWNIYCMAWKYLDNSKVYSACVSVDDVTNDYLICKTFGEVLKDTKLVVGHNLDKFDIKKFNARLIKHKLPPIDHKILTLDTYKAAKKHFSFSSNRLDYLSDYLGVGRKLPHPAVNPWFKLLTNPDQETLNHMVKYCKHDVSPLLEEVYLCMKPYIDHPNLTDRQKGDQYICTHCGSTNITLQGTRFTRTGKKMQKYACSKCHGYGSDPIREESNETFNIK